MPVNTWEFRFVGRNARSHAVLFADALRRDLPQSAAQFYQTEGTSWVTRASLTLEQANEHAVILRREYGSFQRHRIFGA